MLSFNTTPNASTGNCSLCTYKNIKDTTTNIVFADQSYDDTNATTYLTGLADPSALKVQLENLANIGTDNMTVTVTSPWNNNATSIYEGFGNVLVEAGMFKVPIISTNCKSGPKEILNYGKFGDLIKIDDTKTLSKLIVKNLKKPNKLKILKMYKSLKIFNIKNHIKKYEEIFNKV